MEQTRRVALIGLNQTPLDWKGNLARIEEGLTRARDLGASIMIFPELVISGYGCEDRFLHPDTATRSLEMVQALAQSCGDEIMLVGFPFLFEEHLYNAVAVLNQGRIAGINLKSYLAREGIHYEPRWFTAWPAGKLGIIRLGDLAVPIGTLTYQAAGLCFSLEICEDAWVRNEDRPCRLVEEANWIFNCSASHFSMGKADIREKLVCDSSAHFKVGYAYCNMVGCHGGRAIYDGEQLLAYKGRIIDRSDRLYLNDVLLLVHDIPYEARPDRGQVILTVPETKPHQVIPQPTLERYEAPRSVEFAMAASLALLDYMRKSRSRGFTLSLSGGVDSSCVAVLVYIMAQRILSELSEEERQQHLGWFEGLPLDGDVRSLMAQLLTTVYQATRNSGPVTREAAEELAHAVGARHMVLDVDELVEGYKRGVSEAIGRQLSWDRDDIALQNIQARVRAPSVWMLANITGSLLLTTSNRSEVAVGYATMDGDTCGGLAPIAGVEKSFLRRWLVVMERDGLPGIAPIPALKYVNDQQPTAELRPPSEGQSDEEDLMPYAILDGLEAALIAQRKTPLQAFLAIRDQFGASFDNRTLADFTKRFCRLFAVNQWKRERYAPAFHLDDRNLDPKTWARYPILSGAFALELEELEAYLAENG